MADNEMKDLIAACDSLTKRLCDAGIKAESDTRDNYSPGWKYNHWELKVCTLKFSFRGLSGLDIVIFMLGSSCQN